MIEINEINFSIVKDPIKTEETIYNQIKEMKLPMEYAGIPLAYSINNFGLEKTQQMIDEINKISPDKKFFVCQHIQVKNLNFGNNLVFTPHTEKNDDFLFIPHYNPIYKEKPNRIKFKDRDLSFSFMGDFGTNPIRKMLSVLNSEKSPIIPTGMWFFSHEKEKQNVLIEKYIDLLNRSKISLCPMGTGPSTLRLFESMSVGSIPIIFNNLKLPSELNDIIKKIEINDFLENPNVIDELIESGESLSENIYEIYWEFFSNDNLYKNIINSLI